MISNQTATTIASKNQNLIIILLNDELPRVQIFKSKWASIRVKLTDLHSQLTDLSLSPHHPLSLDLVNAVNLSLSDAVNLSVKSQSTLTEGKLRTQSEIDAVLAKLDSHVRDAEVLIKSGVLVQNDTVISGSNFVGENNGNGSSKREAVRVELKGLVTRLQIGSVESKNSAIDSLLGLLNEDDKNVVMAVGLGVVPVLVKVLEFSGSVEMKEKAVAAVSKVSVVDGCKSALLAEGLSLLNHLLRVLDSGSGFAKEKACVALQALSVSKENARVIGSRGGVSSLLEICQAGTPGSQACAAGVLRNLAAFDDVRERFVEENAVLVFLGMVSSGTVLARENAIGCLCNLVVNDDNLKVLVVKEGGMERLRNFWDSGPAEKSLEAAVDLVRHLASNQAIAEILVSYGFIERIAVLLDCGVLGVRIAAARAIHELGFNTKAKKEMGDCGCIAPLVKLLDGKAVGEKEAAAKALSGLLLYAGNRRVFRKDERGVVSIVQLLDPAIQNLDKKYPVSVLASLVHSKKCRKQMVAAGATVHLKKLVEMNVEGSKKLLDCLGKGKIWGVFARS